MNVFIKEVKKPKTVLTDCIGVTKKVFKEKVRRIIEVKVASSNVYEDCRREKLSRSSEEAIVHSLPLKRGERKLVTLEANEAKIACELYLEKDREETDRGV